MHALSYYVESESEEYCEVLDKIDQMTIHRGFRFLNSQECLALIEKSEELLNKTIAMSGSDDLKKLHSMWNDQLRKRGDSMLERIYDFCRKNPFTEGVLLVGAGHLSSIVEGIESRIKTEAHLVGWNIWNRL